MGLVTAPPQRFLPSRVKTSVSINEQINTIKNKPKKWVEIKTFSTKCKLSRVMASRPAWKGVNGPFVGKCKRIGFSLLLSVKDKGRLKRKDPCKMEFVVRTQVKGVPWPQHAVASGGRGKDGMPGPVLTLVKCTAVRHWFYTNRNVGRTHIVILRAARQIRLRKPIKGNKMGCSKIFHQKTKTKTKAGRGIFLILLDLVC